MRLSDAFLSRLNADGERHPLENALAVTCTVLGLVALLALLPGWWDVAGWCALAGALAAAYDEFIAKTSGERWLILTGFSTCLVALGVAMSQGGIL